MSKRRNNATGAVGTARWGWLRRANTVLRLLNLRPVSPASRALSWRASVILRLPNLSSGPLNARVCDCCQTDSAVTTDGPVVVYRNRTTDEIRDIYITRLQAGTWSEGQPVADDGWRVPGCPVNGPAIDAHGRTTAVAWFTGHPTPRVRAAMSTDSGVSFNPPVTISEQQVVGRVDIVLLNDQEAVITWLEDNPGRLLTRRISLDGRLGAKVTIAHLAIERNAGFPRATLVNGALAVAWTDVSEGLSQVRVSTLELAAF